MKETHMKHMITAAEAGNADAQYNLGIMYDNRVDDHGNSVLRRQCGRNTWSTPKYLWP